MRECAGMSLERFWSLAQALVINDWKESRSRFPSRERDVVCGQAHGRYLRMATYGRPVHNSGRLRLGGALALASSSSGRPSEWASVSE
jgi:hypothetical protein